MAIMGAAPHLLRMAIEVPDLDIWISKWERIIGPGFETMTVQQPTGDVLIAIHPAGIELVQSREEKLGLRSFHLAVEDIDELVPVLDELGWDSTPGPVVQGRQHQIVSAEGLRMLLVEVAAK
jgi:hypothetical protein